MTNQQAPEIYTLHTVPNKGERPWSGIYAVRADAEHDAKVMRDATGRDWSVVRLVVADTATTPTGPVARYKISYATDDRGMRSSTPSGIPDHAGAWVRYEDHIAALVEARQPTTHVQNPAEIEHVADDVSENGAESHISSLAHEIFALAQLAPGEGIEDAVARISATLRTQQPAPAGEESKPHGWLYDWTHSSATGKPDTTYTGFTKDEAHARKHDNCIAVFTTPQPAPATQQAGADDADMFWDHDDPERFGYNIKDIISDYGPGDVVKINCAKRMPTIQVRVVADGDDDLAYEVFGAPQPSPTAQAAESVPAVDGALEVADAMADSQYLAGVSAGWNAANADDPNAALQKLHESRAGYLQPIRTAARALALSTPPAEQQAASSAVLKAIHEANMQLVRTGDDAFMLVPYKVATVEQQAAPKAAPGGALDEAMRERDDAEDFIDALLDEVLGHERPEWSNLYGCADALNDVQERMTSPHKPAVDKAWGQFQSAMAAPQQEAQEPTEIPEEIERMAADRYKVVPSHVSMFHRWAVVAGTGTQQLYLGREVECQNMARKFACAFLDGAFFAMQRTAPQPVEREPLTDEQLAEMMRETWGCASIAPRHAIGFARAIEAAHGIGIKGGQHGAE